MAMERTARLIPTVRSLFLLVLLAALPAQALSPEKDLQRLAMREAAARSKAWESPYWLKLLYYEKTLFGHYKSPSASPAFFLSRWGAVNPRLELEAALDGFFYEGKPDDSPECRFPERYRWLRGKFAVPAAVFPPPVCAEFEDWKASLDAGSAGLVFAAGYLNNPSTLYGHTFLRLHKRGAGGADLLDYTINYAADAGEDKGFLFALKGLVGAYPGRYSTLPYYLKIQTYHNLENRDLWEFPLGLDQEEMDRLQRHAWELGKASFPYLFFSRNCSWQLLPFLEIVKPEMEMSKRFHFWVIPSDTVKAVAAASPAAAPLWRPSLWNTIMWKRAQLSAGEKAAVLELARGDEAAALKSLETAPAPRKAAVLEAAADYIGWRFYARKTGQGEMDRRTDPVLAARAPLGAQATFTGAPARPGTVMEGHESFRFGAGLVALKNGPAYELQGRFAMQDLLDCPKGYLPDAALEMGNVRLRYEPLYNRLYFKEGLLVHVVSLNPWDDWVRKQSWEVSAGMEQAPETGRQSGRAAVWAMSTGAGAAVETHYGLRQLWYAMLVADSAFGPALNADWRAGAGVKAGLLAETGPLRLTADARYISYPVGDGRPLWAGAAGASVKLARDTSVRAQYAWRGEVKETGLYLHQFFFAP